MNLLNDEIVFPSVDLADENGLIAIGGDLKPERLLAAYKLGIFPWYNEDEPIAWWCPNPRFVLYPNKLIISKSMKTVLQNGRFKFTINRNFDEVIKNCKTTHRKNQDGTWISTEVENAYIKMHALGYAQSAETWENGKLVGGLYGIKIGKIFFGESMFSLVNNASKFAFINMVKHLQKENIELIDCQIYTSHLASLGAKMMDRTEFIHHLKKAIE